MKHIILRNRSVFKEMSFSNLYVKICLYYDICNHRKLYQM